LSPLVRLGGALEPARVGLLAHRRALQGAGLA